jgi:hypothetical protein
MAGSSTAGAQDQPPAPALPAENASPAVPPVDQAGPEPDASVPTATVEIEQVVELWPAVVDHVRESGSAMLSTLFDEAKPLGIDQERSVLRIGFPESAKFNKKKAESPANVERMGEALSAIGGVRLRPVYELIDGQNESAAEEQPPDMSDEEKIDLIKDNFDATEVVADDKRESEAG